MPPNLAYASRSALPSEWDRRQWSRHHPEQRQEYLKVDGLTVKYVGPGEVDEQAASIVADHAVPADLPLYYFEVSVISRGDHGYIGIGFCSQEVKLGRLPGWEPHSYGYHGDDGHVFHGSGVGRAFGPTFTTGDVIGALLHRGNKTISYYKNGEFVGTAFHDVQEAQLYPCVGMRTPHEEIRANFGGDPFLVHLAAVQAQYRSEVLQTISSVQLPVTVSLQPGAAAAAAVASAAGKGRSDRENKQAAFAGPDAAGAAASGPSSEGASGQQQPPQQQECKGPQQDSAKALLAALRGGGGGSSSTAAAAGGSGRRQQQPMLPYLVFDYLLHQRCWQTAALVARDMLSNTDSSSGSSAAAAAAGVSADVPTPMECSEQDDADMTDGPAAVTGAPSAVAAPAATATGADCSSGGGDGGGCASAVAAAVAAAGAVGGLSEADIRDALARQQIFDAVCQGRLSAALEQVAQLYGSAVLDSNPSLAFKLKVQVFVELVRAASSSSSSADDAGGDPAHSSEAAGLGGDANRGSSSSSTTEFEVALAYGRAELGPGSRTREDEELLSDALSLLAYAVPAASPCGHLLRPAHRTALAEELNGALLKARGTSAQPLLETLYRQAAVVVDELKRQGLPAALVLDVPGLLLAPDAGGGGAGAADKAGCSSSRQQRAVAMKQD